MTIIQTPKPHPRAHESWTVRNARSRTGNMTPRFLRIFEAAVRSHGIRWPGYPPKLTKSKAIEITDYFNAFYNIRCRIENVWTITLG